MEAPNTSGWSVCPPACTAHTASTSTSTPKHTNAKHAYPTPTHPCPARFCPSCLSSLARPLVHRADVEAGRAADAVERLAPDLVGEHVGAAVVEEHEVKLTGSVALRHPGPQRRVRVHPLRGGGPGQQLEVKDETCAKIDRDELSALRLVKPVC